MKSQECHNYSPTNKEKDLESSKCPSCSKSTEWYRERIFIVSIVTVILVILGYFLPFLRPFYIAFMEYLRMIWWAILIGFIIGGIIDYFIPQSYIEKYFSRHRKRTILYAVVFGFLMSACSHGILAIAIELYRKGANTAAVISFLLASPWANLPITFLLFGFFGLKAFYIILSAIFIAIVTGLIYQILERNGMVECNKCNAGEDKPQLTDFSVIEDIKKRLLNYNFNMKSIINAFNGIIRGSWTLSKMVLWWLLVGMLMAAFARAYIPSHLFVTYVGPTVTGLLLTLLFATIIEVCSEGSSPLAFEIFNQTKAFGNSFTFLMAGVATDYTEIGLIWSNIGRKAALWLPIITVPQVLIVGFIFNNFI